MYRCSHYPCEESVFRKYVSEEMADYILCVFGPLDADGCFKSIDRVRKYMSKVDYLKELIGKTIKTNDGVLGDEIQWEEFVKARYEDIYYKLADTEHEYTFDEIGEGFIKLLFDLYSDGNDNYLATYEDNIDRFVCNDIWIEEGEDNFKRKELKGKELCDYLNEYMNDEDVDECIEVEDVDECIEAEDYLDSLFIEYIPYHQRENCELHLELMKSLKKGAEEYYDDVIYEKYYDSILESLSYEAPEMKDVCEAYCNYWEEVLTNLTCYSYDGICAAEEILEFSDVDPDDISFCEHFLYWDDDFEFVLPLLKQKKDLDAFVKITGPYLRYSLKAANEIFASCDSRYPIA